MPEYAAVIILSFLPMHGPQQPRRERPSNVFQTFGCIGLASLIVATAISSFFHVVSFQEIITTAVNVIELFLVRDRVCLTTNKKMCNEYFVTDVNFSTQMLIRLSFSARLSFRTLSDSHVSACPNLLQCFGSPHLMVLEISISDSPTKHSVKTFDAIACAILAMCYRHACVQKKRLRSNFITCKFSAATEPTLDL